MARWARIAAGSAICGALIATPAAAGGASAGTAGGGQAPAWSPDGRQIAYVGVGDEHLMVMSSATGSGKRVVASVDPGTQILNETRWASQHRLVFDVVPDGLLRSVDLRSRRVVPLASVDLMPNPAESFTVSKSGRTVAFTALCGCHMPLHAVGIVGVDGRHARLLARPAYASEEEPSLSPDGRRVVFARFAFSASSLETTRSPVLFVESVMGGPARRLASGWWPQWSPDGRWIAFLTLTPRQRLEVVPAAGGAPRALVADAASLSWSPDSTHLAYTTRAGQNLGTVTLAGHVRRIDLRPLLVQSQTPQWSPDGRRIAFTVLDPGGGTNSHVYVIGSASGKPRRLA